MNQTNLITMSFVATQDIKAWLEQRAAKDERSVSYILRKLIERELSREKAVRQKVEYKTN